MKYYFFNEYELPMKEGDKVSAIVYDMENKEYELFFDITFVSVTVSRALEHFVFHFIKDGEADYRVRPLSSASYSIIAFEVKALCGFVSNQINISHGSLKTRCEDLDELKERLNYRLRCCLDVAEKYANSTIFKLPDDFGTEEIIDYRENDTIYIFNGILSCLDKPIERTIKRMYVNDTGCKCLEFKESNYPIAMYSDKTFPAGKTLRTCFNNMVYAIRKEINDRKSKLNAISLRNKQLIQIMVKITNYGDII
jgi:hypothetical protein